MTTTKTTAKATTTSIYDSIPNLDSWYECKNHVVSCNNNNVIAKKKRKANIGGCVSFSSAPPAVFHYQEKSNIERPVQYTRRNSSSSESVKVFLKHYTSKLSRRLSKS